MSPLQRPATAEHPSPPDFRAVISDAITESHSRCPQHELLSTSEPQDMVDIMFSASDIASSSTDLTMQRSLEFLFPGLSQDVPMTISSGEYASYSPRRSNVLCDTIHDEDLPDTWNLNGSWDDYSRLLPTQPQFDLKSIGSPAPSTSSEADQSDVERIATLFCQRTCHKLSIVEGTSPSPWESLIWSLAKDHPVLYHAVAALTYYSMTKQQPLLRLQGAKHKRHSMKILAEAGADNDGTSIAALAATLVLGFAESWNSGLSMTGPSHICDSNILLQQLMPSRSNLNMDSEEGYRLEFLANIWTYMDVLARFTCSDLPLASSVDRTALNLDSIIREPSKLDCLMGYSTTLFPSMRRVADLINRVRARETNSPAIISHALELRRDIEQWTPPIDLEVIDDPSQTMTDAIQTAEAYRWATLLILYQAVPELPNLTSYGELAQKILVYLATIPLSSTTLIVHMFPLMIAGCDAVEEEDRDFVRERWNAMSKRMVTISVDRCLKITEEVWKRREEYLRARGLSFTANGFRVISPPTESTALSEDIAGFINFDASSSANTTSSGDSAAVIRGRLVRTSNHFPISAAFRKGVDMLTRSGCTEYTVRGRLHWLGVMKDWDLQLMLF